MSAEGGVAARALVRASEEQMEEAQSRDGDGDDSPKTKEAVKPTKSTIRVNTAFFKGNAVCLRRCIKENGWFEEKEEDAMGRSVFMW